MGKCNVLIAETLVTATLKHLTSCSTQRVVNVAFSVARTLKTMAKSSHMLHKTPFLK